MHLLFVFVFATAFSHFVNVYIVFIIFSEHVMKTNDVTPKIRWCVDGSDKYSLCWWQLKIHHLDKAYTLIEYLYGIQNFAITSIFRENKATSYNDHCDDRFLVMRQNLKIHYLESRPKSSNSSLKVAMAMALWF